MDLNGCIDRRLNDRRVVDIECAVRGEVYRVAVQLDAEPGLDRNQAEDCQRGRFIQVANLRDTKQDEVRTATAGRNVVNLVTEVVLRNVNRMAGRIHLE